MTDQGRCNYILNPLSKIIEIAISLFLMIMTSTYISIEKSEEHNELSEPIISKNEESKTIPINQKSMIYFHIFLVFSSIYLLVLLVDLDSEQ